MTLSNDPVDWLFGEGDDVVFDHSNALLGTRLPATTLQNWTNRGLFKPMVGAAGRGVRRQYSARDLVVLTIANQLVELDVRAESSISMALEIWMSVLKEVKRTKDFNAMRNAIVLIKSAGGSIKCEMISGNHTADFSKLMDGRPAIIFAAGIVIAKAAGRAMEISTLAERQAGYAKERA